MKHYSAIDIVDLLRAALKSAFDVNRPYSSRIKQCDSADEVFDGQSDAKIRFCIPNPHPERAAKAVQGRDVRGVLFQLEDDSGPILQVQCDGIVIDNQLGSIGLIQFCYGTEQFQKELILRYVREAMGLCHEMQRRASDGRAYYVELVLVIPMLEASAIGLAGNVLREVMSGTGYLHAIGVHVLTYSQSSGEVGFRNSLSKAFSWLMPKARNWYYEVQSQRQRRSKAIYGQSKSHERLPGVRELSLKNIRLPGKRTLEFTDSSNSQEQRNRLHVVHGQNGTGKSTFVDAFELLLTNKVERILRNATNEGALKVLRHRYLKDEDSASAVVSLRSNELIDVVPESVTISIDSLGNPELELTKSTRTPKLSQFLRDYRGNQLCQSPGCFRLEQNMADRLTVGTSGERARTILSSFFPDSDQQRSELAQYNAQWRNAIDQLREAWQDADSVPWLSEILSGEGDRYTESKFWKIVQQLSTEQLSWESVGSLYCDDPSALRKGLEVMMGRELNVHLSGISDQSNDAITGLGIEIDRTISRVVESVRSIENIERLLKKIFAWKAEGTGKSGTFQDFHEAVSDWLTKHAEYDLVRRVEQINATVQQAESDTTFANQLASLKSLTSHETRRRRPWIESSIYLAKRESAWKELINFNTTEDVSRPATRKPEVSDSEIAQIEQWVRTSPSMGQLIREALNTESRQTGVFQDMSFIIGIGDSNSGKSILQYVESVRSGLAKLEELRVRRIPDLGQLISSLRQFNTLQQSKMELDNQAIENLQSQFRSTGELTLALNELMSMFTPARWAYDEVGVSANFQGETPNVSFNTRSQEVSHVLNTAELNILALSLFFLCAPNTPNPLNLLILDDPLQNMDELTVTTVARGIDRLLRLWQTEPFEAASDLTCAPLSDIELLLLLHGEDDTDRFSTETSCATYTLPWLMPSESDESTENKISRRTTLAGISTLRLKGELLPVE